MLSDRVIRRMSGDAGAGAARRRQPLPGVIGRLYARAEQADVGHMSSRDREFGLHGRRGECDLLDHLLGAARAGESQVLVVRGEAGIGKTALLNYAAQTTHPTTDFPGREELARSATVLPAALPTEDNEAGSRA
jgi:hypothetical protein